MLGAVAQSGSGQGVQKESIRTSSKWLSNPPLRAGWREGESITAPLLRAYTWPCGQIAY